MTRFAAVLAAAAVAAGTADAAKTPIPGFRSPSRNISCLYVPAVRGGAVNLLCDIRRSNYGRTLQARCMRPDGSGVDWHGFELGATRRGEVLCTGGILYSPDTQQPTYVVLDYGKVWRHGPFTCFSRRAGVTCRNRADHGVFISREAWRVW